MSMYAYLMPVQCVLQHRAEGKVCRMKLPSSQKAMFLLFQNIILEFKQRNFQRFPQKRVRTRKALLSKAKERYIIRAPVFAGFSSPNDFDISPIIFPPLFFLKPLSLSRSPALKLAIKSHSSPPHTFPSPHGAPFKALALTERESE